MANNREDIIHVGIDLGTTNCSVAMFDGDKLQICNNQINQPATPSWISFANLPGGLIIGEPARNELKAKCIVYDSKRLIGKTEEQYEDMKSEIEVNWPFEVRKQNELLQMGIENPNIEDVEENEEDDGKEWFYPEEISGFLIKDMMHTVHTLANGKKIGKVVVTVPAEFEDAQRKAKALGE